MSYLIAFTFFLLGSVIASFMTVVAERLNTGQSWVSDRSHCNSCNTLLTALDLVPVFSWVFMRGRCRTCSSRIPVSYAVGEAVLGTLFVFGYLVLGFSLPLIPFLLALSILSFIVTYDLRHTVVPMQASSALIVSCLLYALLSSGGPDQLGATLLVAGCVGLGFFLLHALTRGRAMGLGDAPVALALALLTGGALAFAGILFSFWIGAIVGIGILVSTPKGHRMGIEVPFVPFLAAGYLLAYFTQWNPLLLTF